MKIYPALAIIIFFLTVPEVQAQDGSPSPYSFFGLGDTDFKGTVENLSMANIYNYTDSIHYNINTPASLSQLKYVNLNIGMSNKFTYASDITDETWMSAHNISYFSLSLPVAKKMGVGIGILPVNSSNFKSYFEDDLGTYTFSGSGGNTRAFLATGYQVTKNLSLGVEYQYYFGYLSHENYWVPTDNVITYTKENNTVDFDGSSVKLSGLFTKDFTKDHYVNASVNYQLPTTFDASYNRIIRIIGTGEETVNSILDDEQNASIDYPASFDAGLGYGQKNKWYAGIQYDYKDLEGFRNPYYDPSYIKYKTAYSYKIGGMYTPEYNSITKYYKRITYRAGAYYKNTGMNLYDEDITDFGITFGLGLPAIKGISNMNIGFEVGQRGKITENLVKEQYINLHISISLNDKWFIKRKIN